jgi:hypothetical protein
MAPISRPWLSTGVAVTGLALVAVGVILPIANKKDPITGLVIPGVFVLCAAAAIAIGATDDWCGGVDPDAFDKLQDTIGPGGSTVDGGQVSSASNYTLRYTAAYVGQVVPAVRVVRSVPVVGYGQELVSV